MQKCLSANMHTSTYTPLMHSPVDMAIGGSVLGAAGLRARTENAGHGTGLLPTKPRGDPQSQITDNVLALL